MQSRVHPLGHRQTHAAQLREERIEVGIISKPLITPRGGSAPNSIEPVEMTNMDRAGLCLPPRFSVESGNRDQPPFAGELVDVVAGVTGLGDISSRRARHFTA